MDLHVPVSLFWAGSSLEFTFTGGTLHLSFEADFTALEPWISVELNGAAILRAPLERGRTDLCLFRGMTPGVSKRVRVFKETQPITDDPRHRLEVLEVRGGEILPVPPRPLFLECIGDSLTSGEGVIGAREETDWVTPLFSASRSWARRTADMLDADFCSVSQSGWGGVLRLGRGYLPHYPALVRKNPAPAGPGAGRHHHQPGHQRRQRHPVRAESCGSGRL